MSDIKQLSPPLAVHMSDVYFDVSTLNHFWVRRRFQVLRNLWKNPAPGTSVGEIGCGHGLLLKQIEDTYGLHGQGYDLNLPAMENAIVDHARIFCYNIYDRLPALQSKHDVIFLFDVIEHIEDDAVFLEAALFHLKPGGKLIVSVPAYQALFSDYDRVMGHQRRYDIRMLRQLAAKLDLKITAWSYWGLMYLPIILIRKRMLKSVADSDVTRRGFSPPSAFSNRACLLLGQVEFLPNHMAGSSVMAIFERR